MAGTLDGVADLEKKLKALGEVASVPILRKATRAGIKPAFVKAQDTIPVGADAHRTYKGRLVAPGFARRSMRIVTRASEDGRKVSAAIGVRKEAFYAVLFVELGTSKMAARPWLRTSMSSTKDDQERAFADVLKQQIDKVTDGV
jgi:HK97 gp10 family phage protein